MNKNETEIESGDIDACKAEVVWFQVVAHHQDLLSQATGIETLDGKQLDFLGVQKNPVFLSPWK